MSQFHISAQKPTMKIRFENQPAEISKPVVAVEKSVAQTEKDKLRLSGKASDPLAPETLDLFEAEAQPRPQAFMERISTRHNEVSFGGSTVQVAVGLESQAAELLTSANELSMVDAIKKRLEPGAASNTTASSNEVIRTGASIQTSEAVQLQVGVASLVNTDLLLSKSDTQAKTMQHGVYAGVAVKTESVSTRLAFDTAYGQPRIELGAAISISAETATIGLSVSQGAQADQKGLRLGAEVKAGASAVLGLNINQPLHEGSQSSQGTSVGVYLNTRFD